MALVAMSPGPAMPAAAAGAAEAPHPADPYRPYEFLIGDWVSTPAGGGAMTIRQLFRWGPGRAYILATTFIRQGAGPEKVHFEGLMVWNGASRNLDFLFAVEPGSGAQERGIVRVEADGSLVREVVLTGADGRTADFRQTFRSTGSESAVTALMRRTADGWAPSFPGSERLEMSRRRG
jgi:hypothetical protein